MVLATAADKLKQDVKKSISIVTLLTNILLPTGKRITKYVRRAKRFLRTYLRILKAGSRGLPLHTSLLARCSVLHPTDTERILSHISLPVDD